jgi:hypothetical protein
MSTTQPARRNARPHAWVFAISATLGLVPGCMLLFFSAYTIVLFPLVLVFWTIGFSLMWCYWLYLVGAVVERGAERLWTWSAGFNGVMAVGWTVLGARGLWRAVERGAWGDGLPPVALIGWLCFLTGLALHARSLDAPAEPAEGAPAPGGLGEAR